MRVKGLVFLWPMIKLPAAEWSCASYEHNGSAGFRNDPGWKLMQPREL
jgi:hypothetical protein